MGQMMDIVMIGLILVGGYYVVTHPELLSPQTVEGTEGGTVYEDVYDQAPVVAPTPTTITCTDGTTIDTTTGATCPTEDDDNNTLDAEACQNYLQSGEPDALPCTNECGSGGNTDDCKACESACGQVNDYTRKYLPGTPAVKKSINTRTNAAGLCTSEGGSWKNIGDRGCCTCPNEQCKNKCVSNSSSPKAKASGTSGSTNNSKQKAGAGGSGKGSVTLKKPSRTGPITAAKPSKATQCAKFTGATKAACLASYARSYSASMSRRGPSYTGRDTFGQRKAWFPGPNFRQQSIKYPFYQGPNNQYREELQRRFAKSRKYGSVNSPVELKRFQIANDQYYP